MAMATAMGPLLQTVSASASAREMVRSPAFELSLRVEAASSSGRSISVGVFKVVRHGSCVHQCSSKQACLATKSSRSLMLDLDNKDSNLDDDDDEDDDQIMDMEQWSKNKPAGFGVKEYDTSLEDRLLEEIDRDKKAAAEAKVRKLIKPVKRAGVVPAPEGVEVFIGNLPKKRNIERDLWLSLRSASGLLHIRPIVSGNEKTREPVCKGLAFLTFASHDDAEEFVKRFHGEPVLFGKMQKNLSCELAKPSSPFKHGASPRPAVRAPRLGFKESSAIDHGAIKVSGEDGKLTRRSLALDMAPLEEEVGTVGMLEERDEDLLVLEQQIWNELEDEDDFQLEMELEEYESGDTSSSLFWEADEDSDKPESEHQSNHGVNRVESGTSLIFPQSLSKGGRIEHKEVRNDYDEGVHAEQSSGQGFGLVAGGNKQGNFTKRQNFDITSDDSEKKIRELQAKVQGLQSLLKQKNSVKSTREKGIDSARDKKVSLRNTNEEQGEESLREKEMRIASLEKRLLGKARSGSNVSSGKPTAKKRSHSKKRSSKENNSLPKVVKLGSASRLRNRERQIFTDVLSKWSAPTQ